MCDTMVAVGSATRDGQIIFAKNSDRDSNEPQIFTRIPRRHHDLNTCPTLKATYIEVPQVAETYEVVLSRPVWMWGCEMGFNEFGVVIGNEAVFTKEPKGPPSLIGMDMIRLALERQKTAKASLTYIISLLEQYGQGGNCGFAKPMEYHNAFIIADQNEAYVLETAGVFWAYKQIKDGVYAISNGLTLENDFDACHEKLIADAIAKKFCTGRQDFNFRAQYSDPIFYKFSGCVQRRELSLQVLNRQLGGITPDTMRQALSAHNGKDASFEAGSMHSVCCHAGSIVSSQTTASLIGTPTRQEYWYTGSSLPCISLFKPYVATDPFTPFGEQDDAAATAYWRRREEIARMFLTKCLSLDAYRSKLQMVQEKIDGIFANDHSRSAQAECFALCEAFAADMHRLGSTIKPLKMRGNYIFRRYWKKTNKEFMNVSS